MAVIEEPKAKEDPTEVLEPTVEERIVAIGSEEYGTHMVFIQRRLSLFGKMDFFSVMGKALDKAISGPDGISFAELMEAPEDMADLTRRVRSKEADAFVKGLMRLMIYAPEILGDLYCVILSVPRTSRESAKEIMALPEDRGGFSDAEGMAILGTFIDQNWDVVNDFFSEHLAGLVKKVQEKQHASESSKPSKSTRQSTQKRSKT